MTGTRQRQIRVNQSNENPKPIQQTHGKTITSIINPQKSSSQMPMYQRCFKNKYVIVIILAVSIIIYLSLAKDAQQFSSKTVDNLAVSLNLHTSINAIVIDAGSTASRVNGYTFHPSVVNGQLILDHSFFHEIKPGLTFYAKNPKDVKKSLKILLDKAKSSIPKTDWASTPLILRATAGLRLLPGNEAQGILDECKRVLNSSGFKVFNDSVAIMDGSDEGIFSWFTTNYVLKRFFNTYSNDDFAKNTVAALDLGGGSTQITFALTPSAKKISGHEKNVYGLNTFDRNLSVFTESFLGLGLMAARKEILTHLDNYKNEDNDMPGFDNNNNNSTPIELRAECVNPIVSHAQWNYAGKDYLVKGLTNGAYKLIKSKKSSAQPDERRPVVRFSDCLEIIKKVVETTVPRDLPSIREHEIYAFSYYFDRATEAGLIDPFKGGKVTIESIYKSAIDICAYPNVDQPFMCLDLSYIYTLLHDGFGLDKSTKIYLHKYINGHQLNWALGAAFNVLQTES